MRAELSCAQLHYTKFRKRAFQSESSMNCIAITKCQALFFFITSMLHAKLPSQVGL